MSRWEPAPVRFARLVVPGGGCWTWTGAFNPNGYGIFNRTYAHRYSYELHRGPIPAGLHIDHLCRNRMCVNPDHLEPVDNRTNILRGDTLPAANARKTHCKRGHAFDAANTRVTRRGHRVCRKCHADHVHGRI